MGEWKGKHGSYTEKCNTLNDYFRREGFTTARKIIPNANVNKLELTDYRVTFQLQITSWFAEIYCLLFVIFTENSGVLNGAAK